MKDKLKKWQYYIIFGVLIAALAAAVIIVMTLPKRDPWKNTLEEAIAEIDEISKEDFKSAAEIGSVLSEEYGYGLKFYLNAEDKLCVVYYQIQDGKYGVSLYGCNDSDFYFENSHPSNFLSRHTFFFLSIDGTKTAKVRGVAAAFYEYEYTAKGKTYKLKCWFAESEELLVKEDVEFS